MTQMKFWNDDKRELHLGDCRTILKDMPENSVHCVVTSPPYWSQRKYEGMQDLNWQDGTRSPLGLEPTPELFIAHVVEIFRAVKRVLRDDGQLFIDIDDSMWSSPSNQQGKNFPGSGVGVLGCEDVGRLSRGSHPFIKPLDRCGIPESLILALRADGWYWRSTIIWMKPSCMPESVNGWRWVKHKVKVGDNGRGTEAWRQGANNTPSTRPCARW